MEKKITLRLPTVLWGAKKTRTSRLSMYLELIPAAIGWEAEYTWDRLPVFHIDKNKQTKQTTMHAQMVRSEGDRQPWISGRPITGRLVVRFQSRPSKKIGETDRGMSVHLLATTLSKSHAVPPCSLGAGIGCPLLQCMASASMTSFSHVCVQQVLTWMG